MQYNATYTNYIVAGRGEEASGGGVLKYAYSANSGDRDINNYDSQGTSVIVFDLSIDNNFSAPEITAVPNIGYRFAGWSDGETSPTRHDINVTENSTQIKAYFVRVIELVFQSETGGYISGQINQTIDLDKNPTTVTAIANNGYEFFGWKYTKYSTDYYYWSESITPNMWDFESFNKITFTAMFRRV